MNECEPLPTTVESRYPCLTASTLALLWYSTICSQASTRLADRLTPLPPPPLSPPPSRGLHSHSP